MKEKSDGDSWMVRRLCQRTNHQGWDLRDRDCEHTPSVCTFVDFVFRPTSRRPCVVQRPPGTPVYPEVDRDGECYLTVAPGLDSILSSSPGT